MILIPIKFIFLLSSIFGVDTFKCDGQVYPPEHNCYGTNPSVVEVCIKLEETLICGVKR